MEKKQTLRLHSRMFLFYKLIVETYVSLFLFLIFFCREMRNYTKKIVLIKYK